MLNGLVALIILNSQKPFNLSFTATQKHPIIAIIIRMKKIKTFTLL